MQDAVFATDLQGRITSCNQGVDRYGFSPKELIGKNLADFCCLEPQALACALEKGRFEATLQCRTKSGGSVDVHM